MAGIDPNAPVHKAATLSQLPSEVEWLKLNNLPIGNHVLNLHHKSAFRSDLDHVSGPTSFTWQAGFSGNHSHIYVNGTKTPASSRILTSGIASFVDIPVSVSASAVAQVPAILYHEDGKCVSAGLSPVDDTELQLVDSCTVNNDGFVLLPNNILLHAASGYCVHPLGGTAGTNVKLVLHSNCSYDSRLRFEQTALESIKHIDTGMCVHPEGGSSNPITGTALVYYPLCDETRLKFYFQ
jgi:hypothetical protein